MDCQKRCRVGSTHRHFRFARHVLESNPATTEGIHVGHHPFQYESYKIRCAWSFNFHNQKDGGWKAQPIENNINKLLPKEKEKNKNKISYQKIVPPKALVD